MFHWLHPTTSAICFCVWCSYHRYWNCSLHFGDPFLTSFKLNPSIRPCFHFNKINLIIWSKDMLCRTNVYIMQYLTAGYTILLVNSSHVYFPVPERSTGTYVLFFLLSPSLYQTHQSGNSFELTDLKVCGDGECLSWNCLYSRKKNVTNVFLIALKTIVN